MKPAFHPDNIPGPGNILREKLGNGITVLLRQNPDSRTAVFNASIPCGAYLDPMDKTGLAAFTAATLNTGTLTHDFNQLNEILEENGASLGLGCGPRAYTIHGACLAEDLGMLLDLLKEMLDEPAFSPHHIEIHRSRLLSALELHNHDPESRADERLDAILFSTHPYGRPELGTVDEINAITREDLLTFHRNYIGPRDMILTISGGLSAEKMLEVCQEKLGTWQKSQQPVRIADYFPEVPAPQHAVTEHIEIPEKSEITLLIGSLGPRHNSPDFLPAVLGNSILGEFGMMGRIGNAVRQESGLAYSAESTLTSLTYGGCWQAEAGTNPANVEKCADLIMRELKRFTSEKVSRQELEDVKSFYLGSLPLTLESNNGIAGVMLSMESYQLGLDHLLRLNERVNAVTAEDVMRTAQKWLDPEKLIRITAGTAAK